MGLRIALVRVSPLLLNNAPAKSVPAGTFPCTYLYLHRDNSENSFPSAASRIDYSVACRHDVKSCPFRPYAPGIAENSQTPVKSKFALRDLNHSGAAVQWHNNVIFAARSRKRETASATRITSPSGAGTSICVQCTPRSTGRASASASARPACAAAKSLRLNHSPPRA